MACRLRVSCVLRRDAPDPHDRIEAIGGEFDDGSRWWLSRKQAIEGAEKSRWSFYVNWGEPEPIELVIAPDGCKVLACGGDENFLLKLPECAVARELRAAQEK